MDPAERRIFGLSMDPWGDDRDPWMDAGWQDELRCAQCHKTFDDCRCGK